jgi:hypothetical protein
MTMAKVSAFSSPQGAAEYAQELKESGFHVQISGPVDIVLIDKPGTAIDGWSQSGTTWYVVTGSNKDFTTVD